MRHEQIDHRSTADYASIAHGMPEYYVPSFGEIDHGIALARREQSRMLAQWLRQGFARIRARLAGGKHRAA
ncbi:hypothetical protein [Minwuia thermotolerans]|uniref:Uncharacterized protein n=1 Tax=Minwuia thermotolerans TaxID=2056226 RepID=A0A2M9FZM1_9PROT|nr:hypothetical protein [Minwuia thermotolerans]PJK28912.1 hypothetical protein CVT23_14885 [Minwuia thermotolerans]